MVLLFIIKQWFECLFQINLDYFFYFFRDWFDCWNGILLLFCILVLKLMFSLYLFNFFIFKFKDRYIEVMKILCNQFYY